MSNVEHLETICQKISTMEKIHHIEILRIIKKKDNQVHISENTNGTFLNMNDLKSETLNEINTYISLNDSMEQDFVKYENMKNTIIENYIH